MLSASIIATQRQINGCAPVANACNNGRESGAEFAKRCRDAFAGHAQLCARDALKVRGSAPRGYEAGVAAGALVGAAGVAAGVLAGLDGVLVESDVLGVALKVDAGVVLLEVDLLSVL